MNWLLHYLKIVKEYARDYVLENPGLKVLALLITGVLWLSVASRPVSLLPIANVPIEFINLESPALTVSKWDTLQARVLVEGPRDVLDSLRPSQLSVAADMAGVEAGVRVIQLHIDPSRLPQSVKLREIEPRTVRVTVERVVEKRVLIMPRLEGKPAVGYEVIGTQLEPEMVSISGAESQVREVDQVTTESVGLYERTETFSERVAIDIGSPNLRLSDPIRGRVMLIINIGEIRRERTFERVPVTVSNAPRKARAFPPFVRVILSGARSAIEQITPEDISVVVEYQNGQYSYEPRVSLSQTFTDRVSVKSFAPGTVQIR
jgi:YbbR domain-containing protein